MDKISDFIQCFFSDITKNNKDDILVFNNGKLKIDEEKREVIVRGKEIILTNTEFYILNEDSEFDIVLPGITTK